MNKKIMVLEGSPRKNDNTEPLSDELIRGAEEADNVVEKVYLQRMDSTLVFGCNSCRRSDAHDCVFKKRDNFERTIQAVIAALRRGMDDGAFVRRGPRCYVRLWDCLGGHPHGVFCCCFGCVTEMPG